MPARRNATQIVRTVAAVAIGIGLIVSIVAWIIKHEADETAKRQKLSELGVLATLASNGKQIASVNFSTIKDKGRFDEGFEIALELEAITSLNLNGMLITNDDLDKIGELSSLASLSLSGCSVGGKGLESLKGLTQLETLYLNQTQVSDEDLKDLRHFQKLTAIDLSGAPIQRNLSPLSELPKLKLIVLSGVTLADGALSQLSSSTTLSRLSLVKAEYETSDLKALKEMIPSLVVDE